MKKDFDHPALHLKSNKKVVFAAMSKKLFYMRFLISKYVLENDAVPINPFTSFDYFMIDSVKRDTIRQANNVLVDRADELWVFGVVSDGVLAEILQAKAKNMPVKYFSVVGDKDIGEIAKSKIEFEVDIADKKELI